MKCTIILTTQLFVVYSGETPALYTVISEKATSVGGAMMGSSHVYDLAAAASGAASGATIGGGATPAKKVWSVGGWSLYGG